MQTRHVSDVADQVANRVAAAGASASAPGSVSTVEEPAAESVLAVPAEWHRLVHPRRGGLTAGPVRVRDRAVAKLAQRLAGIRDELVPVLSLDANDPLVNSAGQAHLNDSGHAEAEHAEPSPLGAAAVACAAAHLLPGVRMASFAELWISEHGLVFAARALVELVGLTVDADVFRTVHSLRRQGADPVDDTLLLYGVGGYAIARELRRHLAGATDQDYRAVVDALAAHLGGSPVQRLVLPYLLPTQTEWVARACADVAEVSPQAAEILVYAVSSVDQLDQLTERVAPGRLLEREDLLPTLVDGIGPAVAGRIARWLDAPHLSDAVRTRAFRVLAVLPTDEALGLLGDRLEDRCARPAVVESLERFPVRGLRVLAAAASVTTPARSVNALTAAHLLRVHVVKHQEVVAAARPALAAAPRALVEQVVAAAAVEDAPAEALPAVLVAPPWRVRRRAVPPVVVPGLVASAEPGVRWAAGEQESWAEVPPWLSTWSAANTPGWDALATRIQAQPDSADVEFFLNAPDETARPLLGTWHPDELSAPAELRPVAARFGTAALPALLRAARTSPSRLGALLMPFTSAEVATLMADWLVRLKSARHLALAWLHRHPGAAAQGLVPTAVGGPGQRRRAAESALLAIAAAGHDADVRAAAQHYGGAAANAVDALLDSDPLHILPSRIPALPDWLDPTALPRVLLADGRGALPQTALAHLCTMLAMSEPGAVYAGIPLLRQACTAESLAEFGWALFQDWRLAGAPAKDGWALTALGWLGDDETVRRLTPLIRAWPGDGGHARAVAALDVLVGIGTDTALTHLHNIAQHVRFAGLREQARRRITDIATSLGLTAEQLADRLVPDLGLDPDGGLVLDYGPRQFTVGFDEHLRPHVLDHTGARHSDLPEPGARDDQDLAPAARTRFAALKKNARAVVADQVRRLEAAMITQRRWTSAEFHTLFVRHPLLWHLARRLVWTSQHGAGPPRAFRVAEDRTFADVHDNTVHLDAHDVVGIPHPVLLGADLTAWAAVFGDYAIVQPFAQLGRDVHRLTAEERDSLTLDRFVGVTAPTTAVLGLERRGWARGAAEDGVQELVHLRTPGNRSVVVALDPGVVVDDPLQEPSQTIRHVWLSSHSRIAWATPHAANNLAFGALDPVVASEVLRDLTELVG